MSDDELEVSSHNFAKILRACMGAGPAKNMQTQNDVSAEDAGARDGDNDNVAPGVREAFDFAHEMWQIPAGSKDEVSPPEAAMSAEDLDNALAAATA